MLVGKCPKPSGKTERKYVEWDAERKGTSWKAKLKAVIDVTIPKAKDFDDFLRLMEAAGYEIKRGKYISFRAPGQERFTRSKTLGEAYTVEAITERIAGTYRAKPKALRQEKAGVSMLIDIQNSIKAAESKGYEQWAKIHNLKQAAKTLNFLTEHDISEYEQLQAAKNGGKLPTSKRCIWSTRSLRRKKTSYIKSTGS